MLYGSDKKQTPLTYKIGPSIETFVLVDISTSSTHDDRYHGVKDLLIEADTHDFRSHRGAFIYSDLEHI